MNNEIEKFESIRMAVRKKWLRKFSQNLPFLAAKYGITLHEVHCITDGLKLLNSWSLYKKLSQIYTNEFKDLGTQIQGKEIEPLTFKKGVFQETHFSSTPDVFTIANSIVNHIKADKNYNKADGQILGIEESLLSFNLPAHLRQITDADSPSLIVILNRKMYPQIIWEKKSMDALEIHVDRGNGFRLLAIVKNRAIVDKSTIQQPNNTVIWKYKACYHKNGKPVGKWSDEVCVTISRPS